MRRLVQSLRMSRSRKSSLVAFAVCLTLLAVVVWPRPNTREFQDAPRLSESHVPGFHDSPLAIKRQHVSSKNHFTQKDDYRGRRQRLIDHCQRLNGPEWSSSLSDVPNFDNSPIISTKHNLMYCPVGKIASSFFTRYVLSLNKPGPMTSPFDIPILQAGRGRCESLKTLGNARKTLPFLKNATKVVFGRNPFSRIFSAYIDKLFSPNPFYWKQWGQKSLEAVGDKVTKCATNVPFSAFVKHVIKNLYSKDVHLRPAYDECKMCDVIYDVVGKLESTTNDLDYLSAKLNISSAFQHAEGYDLNASMDIILDSVESPFSWTGDIKACMSMEEMGRRIWRKLQIRGVIDSSLAFPFNSGEMDTVSVSTFIANCRSGLLASTDRAKLKRQKTQAFLEAYASVSTDDMRAISKVYYNEFSVFGYDPEPATLFQNRSQVNMTGFLDWKKQWLLTT